MNKGSAYTVNIRTLGNVVEQIDLGVRLHCSLKMATQVGKEMRKT